MCTQCHRCKGSVLTELDRQRSCNRIAFAQMFSDVDKLEKYRQREFFRLSIGDVTAVLERGFDSSHLSSRERNAQAT